MAKASQMGSADSCMDVATIQMQLVVKSCINAVGSSRLDMATATAFEAAMCLTADMTDSFEP